MYKLAHNITIGNYRLKLVDEVRVTKSIDSLSDTASIRIPSAVMNHALEVEDKINEGDQVDIELGYDGDLRGEFRGYVDRISTDGGAITIECVDSLYLFKKSLANKQYKKIALRDLLKKVCAEVNSLIDVECDYDVVYDTFTIFKATGYDVLSKVQDDIKANIYFSGRTLHVHAPYKKVDGGAAVRFDFAKNIEKSDLRYVRAKDRKVEVELTIYNADGQTKKVSYGTTGGEKVERTSVTLDEVSAKKMAKNEYEALVFDGYEGYFTGWMLPFVNPTYAVELTDADRQEKSGRYYVVGVEVSYSRAGGSRKVTLGRKIK